MKNIHAILEGMLTTQKIGYGESEVDFAAETIKDYLRTHDFCNIYYENGEIHVSSAGVVKNSYAKDYASLGTLKAEEVYTTEERMINYAEEFHDYPIWYKGNRDYTIMKEADAIGYTAKFAIENGDLVLVK